MNFSDLKIEEKTERRTMSEMTLRFARDNFERRKNGGQIKVSAPVQPQKRERCFAGIGLRGIQS